VKELSKKIYVGNLSFDATEEQVSAMFAEYGKVDSIAMINDRDTGRFRGFGFVEMEDSAANAAIKALNDTDLDGRTLRVNEARPREERNNGGGRRNNKYPYSGGGNY
jgi:RNA recognition motif-containing protein